MTDEIKVGSGSDEVTIYTTEEVEQIIQKTLEQINPPTSTGNQDSSTTPKPSKIIDLLRVKRMFKVQGFVDPDDIETFISLFLRGGTFRFTYGIWDFPATIGQQGANSEKVIITEETEDSGPGDKATKYHVEFDAVIGTDI